MLALANLPPPLLPHPTVAAVSPASSLCTLTQNTHSWLCNSSETRNHQLENTSGKMETSHPSMFFPRSLPK